MTGGTPLLRAEAVTKRYGGVEALRDVSIDVRAGEITCLLGDNGAGKSTLIKVLSGVVRPDSGAIWFDGERIELSSPRDALRRGIATVFQDLALVGVMPIYRNFFLGREPTRGRFSLGWFDSRRAREIARRELREVGIDLRDMRQPVETLSGGQRQCVAIARAVYFGARVLILDEPTSALGVREAELVLRHVLRARASGIGVVLITHNVHHAYPVGDSFVVLRRGGLEGTYRKEDLTVGGLVRHMAGGAELTRLQEDLEKMLEAVGDAG
ncbi:ATP-binding cassette domain-containing protein [Dactylosporangium sucinum]|uniref:Sugar ABC transporter ATP-binding protein n=1 Tax=Dactylosporangium sucinum TaxID=1424081 RepID=A0A917WWK5_9ACTN|nr:ATP-binding cassette domain-containing protein [Dactylosporangium sucinum]GGM36371.1 sugar ABC transporter ATP-binding protein [Dactylosporangium sucinum]